MLVTLNEVLHKAREGGYAVGLFNATDSDMLEATISAAEELRSPIIIGTAEVLLPFGELDLIAPGMIAAAKRASVPVVVHYDHGLTKQRCLQALDLGFSSIMFDGSANSPEQNLADTYEMTKIAHQKGASIEGEIGHVGDAAAVDNAVDRYTTVEEAKNFLDATGVDALAIAIGTAHGAYKQKPKLDFDRLAQIKSAVDVPLVLHGGSGLADIDFITAISKGISKVNIFTDLCLAGSAAVKESVLADDDYLITRNLKVKAIKEAVMKKMMLFGSQNKA
ncbi:MAG: class II fructose-bisphosphate aldolase [Oscillospiraceae bacterium]|nr:class II fructose-bisphosphate aldolase [Candidatus Equicaccousia limihippi]